MSMYRSRSWLYAAAFLVLALVLAACTPADDDDDDDVVEQEPPVDDVDEPDGVDDEEPAPPAEMTEVLLAIPAPSLNFLPYMLTVDRGLDFYEQEGIDLTVDIIRGDVALAGLLEGSIDFTAAGGTAMRGALGGAPVRAVMFTVGQTTFSVVAEEEIQSVADLRGRTVGIVGAGLSDTTGVALQAALRAEDIDAERDLDVFVAPIPPDILSALIGGSINAAVLAPPQSIIAEEQGFVEIAQLWDYIELTQGQIATATDHIENNRDLVKAFIRASLAAIAYVVDNPDEAVDYIVERFELEPEVAERSYEVLRDAYARDGQASEEAVLGELGQDATIEDVDRTVDWTLLEEVLAEQ